MGRHRNNYTVDALKSMIDGEDPVKKKTYLGMENSQVHGTSVVIFTLGNCPMRLIFSYPDMTKGGMKQSYSKYVTSESFKCTMAPGYITILVILDDMCMYHEVTFEGVEFDDVPKEERRSGRDMVSCTGGCQIKCIST